MVWLNNIIKIGIKSLKEREQRLNVERVDCC